MAGPILSRRRFLALAAIGAAVRPVSADAASQKEQWGVTVSNQPPGSQRALVHYKLSDGTEGKKWFPPYFDDKSPTACQDSDQVHLNRKKAIEAELKEKNAKDTRYVAEMWRRAAALPGCKSKFTFSRPSAG
ncbi:MAG TPA: hypothetical protein VHB73_00570 [Alphaproteobacteria bacterium]|nr:hypothetical protein [Alphaproteobacteria bacterium]